MKKKLYWIFFILICSGLLALLSYYAFTIRVVRFEGISFRVTSHNHGSMTMLSRNVNAPIITFGIQQINLDVLRRVERFEYRLMYDKSLLICHAIFAGEFPNILYYTFSEHPQYQQHFRNVYNVFYGWAGYRFGILSYWEQ